MRLLMSSKGALRVHSKARRLLFGSGRYVVISAMPKSGSTYLSRLLAEITGYQHSYFGFGYANAEQELYLPQVIDAYGVGTVTQQHFKANAANLEVLRAYSIRPVVLVRNIFDSIVSLRDHLVSEDTGNLPGLEVDEQLRGFEKSRQLDFVIDLFVPWYLSFYISWCRAEANNSVGFLWLKYEDAAYDWSACAARVLRYSGLAAEPEVIARAMEMLSSRPRSEIRLRHGTVGRGVTELSAEQIGRVRSLAAYYPSTAFGQIGI